MLYSSQLVRLRAREWLGGKKQADIAVASNRGTRKIPFLMCIIALKYTQEPLISKKHPTHGPKLGLS